MSPFTCSKLPAPSSPEEQLQLEVPGRALPYLTSGRVISLDRDNQEERICLVI